MEKFPKQQRRKWIPPSKTHGGAGAGFEKNFVQTRLGERGESWTWDPAQLVLARARVRVACEDVCGRRHGWHMVIEWGLLWMCACSIVKNVSNDLAALEPAPQWYVFSPSGDAILSSMRPPINFRMNSEASGVQGNTQLHRARKQI